MAAPSTSYQMLRRFILPCTYVPLRSPPVFRAEPFRFYPLNTLLSFSSSRSYQFFRTPSREFSRQFSGDVAFIEEVPIDSERGPNAGDASLVLDGLGSADLGVIRGHSPAPRLSVKEKKELASYANSLGRKLKSQQVGKSGVTDTVVMALCETLEANELLKLKIHGTCPGEFEDVVNQLEISTGSVVVGQIGRTVILYRPSLTKLKAEEKRKHAQRAQLGRPQMLKQSPQSKKPVSSSGQELKLHSRGRRGSSRF